MQHKTKFYVLVKLRLV